MKKNNSERGNVFVFILLAVALFGALAMTFTRGSTQGTSSFTKQELKAFAAEIINYGSLMKKTVNKLRVNGCSENQISFENSIRSGFTNPNAPGDNSCHVF